MRQKTKTSDARTDPTAFFDNLEEWAPMQDAFHFEAKKTEKYLKDRKLRSRSEGHKYRGTKRDRENSAPSNGNGVKRAKMICHICGKNNHWTNKHRGASKEEINNAYEKYKRERAEVSTKVLPQNDNLEPVEGIQEVRSDGCHSSILNSEGINTLSIKSLVPLNSNPPSCGLK